MSVYKRGRIWWVRFEINGTEVRESSRSTSRPVAVKHERALRERHAEIHRGGRPRRTLKELMGMFAAEHMPSLKEGAARRYRVSAKALRAGIGDATYLDEIGKATIAEFVTERRKVVSDATIRRDLACLSSALSLAVERDWLDHNIVKSLPKRSIKESKPRVRWLRPKEWTAIQAKAGAVLPACVLLVETGMRLGEMLALTWADIDLDRKEIYLHVTKTGAPRVVPLSETAVQTIKKLPRHLHCQHLFFTAPGHPHAVSAMSNRLSRVIRKAGVSDFRPHDFRHTFASWYLQRGGRLERLKEVLGHKRLEQTLKYAHLSTADLHDDLARVGTKTGTDATDSHNG